MKKVLKSGNLSADKSADCRSTVDGVNVIAVLLKNVRHTHESEELIDKFVPRVTVWPQAFCEVMPNSDSKDRFFYFSHLSRVVRKPAFCICKNKDADQLRGSREADQRLCFRYIDRTIPLLPKYEISSL